MPARLIRTLPAKNEVVGWLVFFGPGVCVSQPGSAGGVFVLAFFLTKTYCRDPPIISKRTSSASAVVHACSIKPSRKTLPHARARSVLQRGRFGHSNIATQRSSLTAFVAAADMSNSGGANNMYIANLVRGAPAALQQMQVAEPLLRSSAVPSTAAIAPHDMMTVRSIGPAMTST